VNIGVSGSKVENQSTYISAFQGQSNRLVLWVGINNLGASDTPVQVAAKYWQLIQDQKNNFQKIYCLSVMPINHDQFYAAYGNLAHYMEITYLNVVSLNNYLKTICPNFIDIVKIVTIYDQNNSNYGELNPDFTKDGDGIHLNDAGYVAVFNVLNDYLYYR
jgi:lysophospholipase L1-like esterase